MGWFVKKVSPDCRYRANGDLRYPLQNNHAHGRLRVMEALRLCALCVPLKNPLYMVYYMYLKLWYEYR